MLPYLANYWPFSVANLCERRHCSRRLEVCEVLFKRPWKNKDADRSRLSWKVPECKQIHKFSQENVIRYVNFLNWIGTVDPQNLVFLDEFHTHTKGACSGVVSLSKYLKNDELLTKIDHDVTLEFNPKLALGPIGQRILLLKPGLLPKPRSVTMAVTLSDPSMFHWTSREGSNSQSDFLDTLETFVRNGVFRPGQTLVMDNARVHTGDVDGARQRLQQLLEDAGIGLVFLPTYSPELNPIEFVFSRLKNHFRSPHVIARHQLLGAWVNRDLDDLILDATLAISRESIENTYRHCRELNPNGRMAHCLRERGMLDD